MSTLDATRAHGATGPARQRGQSMVEVAVAMAVLVPLFLLVPVLAKYVHTRQAVQQAARAAAWEATVTRDQVLPNVTDTRARLVDRHFGRPRDAIVTNAAPGDPNAPVGSVMFNTWSGRPLVRRGDIALAGYGDEAAPGMLGTVASVVSAIPLGWNTPNARGLVTADVTVRPRNLANADGSPARYLAPFDDIDLRFEARQTLLADAWNAAGPQNHARAVRNQVIPLVPTAALTSCEEMPELVDGIDFPNLCPLTKLHEMLGADIGGASLSDLPLIGLPLRLEPGLIEPDVVPYDKLESPP